ncbi:MAG: O-antigen ligase family protein [Betaproteobacteria bacterium]
MNLAAPLAPAAPAEPRWLEVARWSTIVATCGSMISPTVANLGMALMLIGLLASGQAGPRLRQACLQPLGLATLMLVAVIGLAMLWAEVPWRVRWTAFESWRKLWMIPIALALFGPALWKRRLAVAWVAVCGLAAAISFGIVAASSRAPTGVGDLAGSLLRNHSAQSTAFAAGTFVAMWLAADPALARRWRLAATAVAVLLVLNMAFVTPGRSGYLALAVMLSAMAAASLRTWRGALAAAVLAALFAAAIGLSPLARDRIALAVDEWNNAATLTVPTSMGIRATAYENTLEIVRERPLLGTGTGGFGAAYTAHVKDKYTDWRVLPMGDPHNQYLFFLAEQGIFGLVAFLVFIGAALADRGDGTRWRIVAVGLLLGWCATSLLSSHFKVFAEGHFISLMLGAMLARPVPGLDRASAAARPAEATS